MNKNTSVILASAVAAVLALGVVAVAIPHQAFAGNNNPCCDPQQGKDQKQNDVIKVAVGGNGGSGGAGGAGGEGGNGGHNDNKQTQKANVDQDANGGDANGGHGGNSNGGNARA
jgi:hypothetical protein